MLLRDTFELHLLYVPYTLKDHRETCFSTHDTAGEYQDPCAIIKNILCEEHFSVLVMS